MELGDGKETETSAASSDPMPAKIPLGPSGSLLVLLGPCWFQVPEHFLSVEDTLVGHAGRREEAIQASFAVRKHKIWGKMIQKGPLVPKLL